jgi:anti-anti-sigma regulatory factor
MKITTIKATGPETVLKISGEVHDYGIKELDEAFKGQYSSRIVVDLSECSLLSPLVIGLLVKFQKSSERGRKELVLLDPSPIVMETLNRYKVAQIFKIEFSGSLGHP